MTDLKPHLFWKHVLKSDGCWEWQGATNSWGYGRLERKAGGPRRQLMAHRVAYELTVGPIPDGLVLDHLCRNKRCVRADHLEAVTDRENILRGTSPAANYESSTHCPKGHPYDGRRRTRHGVIAERWCSVCTVEKNRRWRESNKASGKSSSELLFAAQLEQAGLAFDREVTFAKEIGRKWRADFEIHGGDPLLVEIEGGIGGASSRHLTYTGFTNDCEKYAAAAILGYRVIRCTPRQVNDGTALSWIRQALGMEEAA